MMNLRSIGPPIGSEPRAAAANRARLLDAGVFCVNIIGGPGYGKTSLIRATLEALVPRIRIGVVTADWGAGRDLAQLRRYAPQVVRVETGAENLLRPTQFGEALARLDLDRLDTLLIENVDCFIGPAGVDLGEDAVAAIFSVAAGDQKAAKYADVISAADVVLLNKTDLLTIVPFDLDTFRGDVHGINPSADLIEASILNRDGMTAWQDWILEAAAQRKRPGVGAY
jgi:hydrogenase nickel incorporation protein HypB